MTFITTDVTEMAHQFMCLGCGKALDLPSYHLAILRRELAANYEVAVTRACTYLEGYCHTCLELQKF